jgi:type IV secretory pathway VirB2 component (pilin)
MRNHQGLSHPLQAAMVIVFAVSVASLASAQESPFNTGLTSLQENILTWLTPVAIIVVMGLGVAAMANRISWAWCFGVLIGVPLVFGSPQIITWARGMFAV